MANVGLATYTSGMRQTTNTSFETTFKAAKPLPNLLSSAGGPLRALLDQLVQREGLDLTLRSALPASTARSVSAGRLHGSCLEIVADNAACATRLRFLQTDLLKALHAQGYAQISELQIRVRAG